MKKHTALPVIDPARCTGCGWCVAACAPHVLSLETANGIKRSSLNHAPGCTGLHRLRAVCGALPI